MNFKTKQLLLSGLAISCIAMSACLNKNGKAQETIPASDNLTIFSIKKRADSIYWYHADSALHLYQKSLALSRQLQFDYGITQNLIGLGNMALNQANYADAYTYMDQGIRHVQSLKKVDSSSLEVLFNNIAALYLHAGNYDEAADYCYKATMIAENRNAYSSIARTVNNFGSILSEMGELDKALEYIEKGKETAYKHKPAQEALSYLYLNEARIHYWKKNYDFALSKSKRSFQLAEEYKQAVPLHDATHLSGMIHEALHEFTQARNCYQSVMQMKQNYPVGKMRAAMSLGKLELNAGNYQQAEIHLQQALAAAQKLNARRELVEIYQYLALFNRKTKNYDQAFALQEAATVLKDSILNLEKIAAVSLLEVKYQIAQKDKEIAESKLMISDQQAKIIRNNVLIGSFVLVGLLTLIFGKIFLRNRQRTDRQKRELAVWQALSEGEEKERVRIARELHDGIGGLLSTLKMQLGILVKRKPEIAEVDVYQESKVLLENTINEVRKTAHNLMPELILRHGLVEAVRIFCSNIQDDEGLKMDFQYYGYIGNLDSGFQLAVYRIIQELLQNIIKHAQASNALVQLSRHNNILDITVEDNGIGFSPSQEDKKGMGLNSIERRVKELNGNMHINSTLGKGTYIYIEFHITAQHELLHDENDSQA